MAESENQLFAGYEILATLGQGGMGTVFKARHQMLHRVVALKVLSPHLANDPDYITRFKREAIAAANLSHPNLVRVFEAGEHEGVHYFAMEFVEGESLEKKLDREGRLGAQEAIAICRQVAEALDYAWQKGKVIHRDVKPDNIFLSQDGQAKVGDLGLAKRPREPGSSASLTQTGVMVGTPHYISPEQARGQKEMDFRADIYSLGCTLYRMLSGQTPYQAEDALGVVLQHVNNPPPDILKVVRDCPRPVVGLLARMMGKVPAMRHGSYYELITELKRVEQQLKAGVGTVPRVVGRASWFQSWPVQYAVASLAAIAVLAGLLVWAPWKGRGAGGVTDKMKSLLTARTTPSAAGWTNSLGMKFVPVPGTEVLFSIWDTRVQDYEVFVKATGRSWKKPSFEQGPTHPAVNVSWDDAKAFCEWLTEKESREGRLKTGQVYRLPTDAEWSEAVGLPPESGSTPKEKDGQIRNVYPWGNQWPPPRGAGNYGPAFKVDDYTNTSPVDSFAANRFGLYDMGGNVWQWCEDFYDGQSGNRVLRGGAWFCNYADVLLSSYRICIPRGSQNDMQGFRMVLVGASESSGLAQLTPPTRRAASTSQQLAQPPTPAAAPKETGVLALAETRVVSAQPGQVWTNSLGMKFVSVPGTEVLFSIWDTRVQDYQAFVTATGRSWEKPRFEQGPTHPAVNVSWDDAKAFCQWLTEKERREGRLNAQQSYRLPTDAEWSVAVGLPPETGSTPKDKDGQIRNVYPWGNQWPPPRGAGNYGSSVNVDDFPNTSPVGSFAANQFGLYDMGGNVWQWCEDLYDGWSGDRVLRGGSWFARSSDFLQSSYRLCNSPDFRYDGYGSRVVLVGASESAGLAQLTPPTPRAASTSQQLTQPSTPATEPKEKGVLSPAETRVAALTTNPKVGEVFTLNLGSNVTMELMGIPPGEFMMGSTKEEQAWAVQNGCKEIYVKREGDAPRKTRIKQGFWLGRTEVTVGQWKEFVNATQYRTGAEEQGWVQVLAPNTWTWQKVTGLSWRNPGFSIRDDYPVSCIQRADAVAFCDWLDQKEQASKRLPTGYRIRLPTEAEWEYACRGGRQGTKFWWGDSKEEGKGRLNWSAEESVAHALPVDSFGQRGRNGFGLADMLGNVNELCLDNYDPKGAHEEPYTDNSGLHVSRGGAFPHPASSTRCATRHYGVPSFVFNNNGFRVCCGADVGGVTPAAATTPLATVASAPPPANVVLTPVAASAAPPAQTQAPSRQLVVRSVQPQPAVGFGDLFNGRDLTGWTPMLTTGRDDDVHRPTTGGWIAQNGELVCVTTENGWLKTERQYGDFILQLEFKLRTDGNSGVYVRCPESGRLPIVGMEIQILDPHYFLARRMKMVTEILTGAIHRVVGSAQPPLRPTGEWNSMEIRCEGDKVEVTLNGTRTASANMSREPKLRDRPRSGYIGLSNFRGEAKGMSFRNIRIKELAAASR